jgi:hypothetical protein
MVPRILRTPTLNWTYTFAAFGERRSQAGSLEPDYVFSEPYRLILQESDDESPLAMQSLDIW